jgi:hypothetical protein
MGKILVSLVSDQTIPTIEFIREMQGEVDKHLFISTASMEERGNRQWILKTVAIDAEKLLDPIVVNEFSFEDIEEKLVKSVNDEDTYVVNLTGGTKVMSLAVYEFFKSVKSEMYYLTGRNEMIKVYPGRRKVTSKLKAQISLSDYLSAYGFEIISQSCPLRPKELAEDFLKYFLFNFNRDSDVPLLEKFRHKREKGLKNFREISGMQDFLKSLGFQPENDKNLSKYECRYLSGDWLEEYLFYFLKENMDVADSAIGLSLFAKKGGMSNEFDVLLMRNNKIFLFECKTSIYIDSEESQTIIGDTIYKSDSLRNKFGLFAQTTVVTLSDLSNRKLESHIKRADASRVKLIGKTVFEGDTLKEELNKL